MGLTRLGAVASALLLLSQHAAASHHHNDHLHSLLKARQLDKHARDAEKRGGGDYGGYCQFPDDPDLVPVTPDMKNKGWAMAPDMECGFDSWCPYACPPGKVMTQWEPGSSYSVGSSINGGLYCDKDGKIHKPFEDLSLCVDGTGTVEAVNESDSPLSFCMTVLPGFEDMIIPSMVYPGSSTVLAIPDTSYWCETAAHYYVNPPGTGAQGCAWGNKSMPIGNWTPYVAGGNTDKQGRTFVKIGWNPVIYEESALMAQMPSYGLRITCDDGVDCNGLPCEINPTKGGLNAVNGKSAPISIKEGNSCVVTVPKGEKAKIVVFDTAPKSGGGGGGGDVDIDIDIDIDIGVGIGIQTTGDKKKEPSPSPSPSTTQAPESSTAVLPTTSSTSLSSASQEDASSSSIRASHTHITASSYAGPPRPSITQGIFRENPSNGTDSQDEQLSDFDSTSESVDSSVSSVEASTAPTESPNGEGLGSRHQGSAAAGLLVAFVATIYLF